MKDIILIISFVWVVSAIIVRRQGYEENEPLKVTILRLILAPLLLIHGLIKWIVFSSKEN